MDLCNRWLNGHRRYANGSCDLPKSSRNLITRNSQGHAFMHRRETIPAGTIKRRLSMGSWYENRRLHVPVRPMRKQPQFFGYDCSDQERSNT
jgi:hypothetical protein